MKFTTNLKKAVAIICCLCMSFSLTGCTTKKYQSPFNPDASVSSFQMVENNMASQTTLFAEELCVSASDIDHGADVDVSQFSSAGLFDLNNKEVLYSKNIHERLYPASTTKIMTALVALKYGNPDDIITVSPVSAGITESGAQLCGLKAGDNLTLTQALHALLMNSANDAGLAIAEHIGGSVEAFADMMNQEAQAIGATNCHFVNPHGLQDDGHYVTAYDLYLIFNEALKYELFTQIISMTSYTTTYTDKNGKSKTFDFGSTNQYLMGNQTPPENITVIGGKTGTTNAAGNCLVLLTKDAFGNPYISVILRCSERGILYEEMSGLLSEINK